METYQWFWRYKKWYKLMNDRNEKAVNITDIKGLLICNGGERGIRTPDTVTRILAFQASPFNHSGTSPKASHYTGWNNPFPESKPGQEGFRVDFWWLWEICGRPA